jgi:hypothetical protein
MVRQLLRHISSAWTWNLSLRGGFCGSLKLFRDNISAIKSLWHYVQLWQSIKPPEHSIHSSWVAVILTVGDAHNSSLSVVIFISFHLFCIPLIHTRYVTYRI